LLAKVLQEQEDSIKPAKAVNIFFERFRGLPVYANSSSNVSEGVRQEAQAAKACAFCFKILIINDL